MNDRKTIKTPFGRKVLDCTYQIPYLAGYSKDGNTIYIDNRLNRFLRLEDGRLIDIIKYLIIHETLEKYYEDVEGYKYQYAHEKATGLERIAVEKDNICWDQYQKYALSEVDRLKKIDDDAIIPKDYDDKPEKDTDNYYMLDKIDKHQTLNKQARNPVKETGFQSLPQLRYLLMLAKKYPERYDWVYQVIADHGLPQQEEPLHKYWKGPYNVSPTTPSYVYTGRSASIEQKDIKRGSSKNFITDAIKGLVEAKDIEKYIDEWHDVGDKISLYDYLGMTPEEYGEYLITPGTKRYSIVQDIINKYKSMQNKSAKILQKIKQAQALIDTVKRSLHE